MERQPATDITSPLLAAGDSVVAMSGADVGRNREEMRIKRLTRIAIVAGIPALLLWWRIGACHPVNLLRMPAMDPTWVYVIGILFVMSLAMLGPFVIFARSPHVLYRPEQIDVRLSDVVGIDSVKEEVVRSLNLFLAHKTFAGSMGGTPRRGLLFEGAPGTGKTYTAKAMAAEAGVPFLFASGTSFQSMMQAASAMKIKNYFRKLRKVALAEGGAIGLSRQCTRRISSRAWTSGGAT